MALSWPKRVEVFIDGMNLFHHLQKYGKQFYRLDYKKLAQHYLSHNEKLVAVKYFTAYYPPDQEGVERHKTFVSALRTVGVTTIFGAYQRVNKKFSKGKTILNVIPAKLRKLLQYLQKTPSPVSLEYETYEEKESDVNLSVNIVIEAYEDKYDKAVIITGDNDIAPAIKEIKRKFPNKEFLLVSPAWWQWSTVKKICDGNRIIQKSELANSQLPDPVNWISKPISRQ